MARSAAPRLSHLQRLTDSRGLIHAACGEMPDRFGGYESNDQADALRLCALASDTVTADEVGRLAGVYFGFLSRARLEDGRIRHACGAGGGWSCEGDDDEVQSRLARALARVMVSELPIRLRLGAAHWWRDLLGHCGEAHTPVAAGNWLIALGQLRAADPGRDLDRAEALANWLMEDCYYAIRSSDWEWFEPQWSRGAAGAAAGLWHAYAMFGEQRYAAVAKITTDFIVENFFETDILMPVGTRGGWGRQAEKPLYDQMPAEVCSIVELFASAARISGSDSYLALARSAAAWFTGGNVRGASLIDSQTGGCSDAIRPNGLDRNQGGTAIVSYLLSEASLRQKPAVKEDASVYSTLG